MSSVDNRVVRMTFDNAQFERNIKSTQKSIEEFEKSLKFDGATASFDELSKATNKLDLSAISKKASDEAVKIESISAEAGESISKIDDAAQTADFSPLSSSAQDASQDANNAISGINFSSIVSGTNEASEGFNALSVVATGALFKIGESISDLVTGGLSSIGRKFKEFALDPITEGFKEYETQMGSIQTIMANTGMNFSSDEDIDTVNAKLDELNTYADKTIYNFTEMTKNIGTFTAAGVGLDESTKAIQGIANMAALSGSTSQQASTAMYQLSQALASGTLKLQDWNSVVNAGMGGKVFQESLKRTARAHGVAVDEMIAANGSFRESLQEGWISSEILTETLNQLAISYEKKGDAAYNSAYASLKDAGYSDEDAEAILKLAKQAELAATEVRTWSQLWDTVGEAIGSNWAQIWRNVIGDFKQATDTFTFLSEQITKAIDGMLGGIVHSSEIFNKSGAIELIFGGYLRNEEGERVVDEITGTATRIQGAIDYLAEAIGKPLGAIKDAFDEVFGMDDDTLAQTLISLSMAFKDFAQSLIISDDAAIALKDIFEGVFSILDVGIQIVMDLGAAFGQLVDFIRSFLDPIIDIVLTVFGQVGRVITWIHDRFFEVRAAVIEALKPFMELIEVVKEAISSFFGFMDIPGQVRGAGDAVLEFLDILWGFIDIPGIIKGIGDAFGAIFHWIGDLTGWNSAVEDSKDAFDEAGNKVSAFDLWIQRLLQNPVIAFFKGIVDAIGGFIGGIKDAIVETLHLNDTGEKLTLPKILGGLGDVILGLLGPLGQFVSMAGNGLGGVVDIVGRLASAFGGFASKLWEAFTSWEPIQNVINKLNEFKDGAINFFLSLPERLSGTADGVEGPLNGIQGMFGGVVDWFNNTINYFSNVSVEQFIEDVRNWANGIIENVRNVFDYFANTSPEQIFEDFVNSIHNGLNNAYHALFGFATQLDTMFPELNGAFGNGLNVINKTLHEGVNGIHDYIAPVLAESDSIPDFFVKLFAKIGRSISDGVKGIIEGIRNFKPSDASVVFDKLGNFFISGATELEKTFPALNGSLSKGLFDAFNSIKKFFSDVTKEGDSWIDVLSKIFDKLGENMSKVPDIIGGALGWVKDRLGEALSWISDRLRSIPGPVGEFFTWLTDNLKGLEQPISDAIEWIKNLFNTMKDFLFGGDSKPTENPVESAVGSFGGDKIDEKSGGFGSTIENIKKFFTDKLKDLEKFMGDIPTKIGEILSGFSEAIQKDGLIDNVVNIIQQILVARLLWSLSDFVKGLGNLTNVAAKYLKQEKIKSMSEKFRDVAIAFGVIAGALFVVSKIEDPWPCVGVLSAMGAVVLAMQTVSGLICKHFDSKAGDQLMKSAATIGIFAASMLLVMYTVKKLTAFPWGENTTGLIAMGIALGILGGLVILITRFGKDGGSEALKAAASIGVLALTIDLLLPSIQNFTKFMTALNNEEFGKAVLTFILLAGTVVAMGGAIKLAGDHALASGAGFLLMGLAISIIGSALKDVSEIDFFSLITSLVSLSVIMGEFAIIAKLTEQANLIVVAGGILIFSAAVGVLAYSLYQLSKVDVPGLIAATVALGILIGVFGALSVILSQQGIAKVAMIILPLLALAFLSLGGAAWLIGTALNLAVAALQGLIATGPSLASFVELIAQNIQNFTLAAMALGEFGMALGGLSFGLAALGGASLIATGGIAALTWALNGLLDFAERVEEFMNVGTNITEGIGQGMANGMNSLANVVLGIVNAIIGFFTGGLKINSPSEVMADEIGQYIPEGIGLGISENSGSMLDTLGEKLGELLNKFSTWVNEEGLPKLKQFGNDILDKLKNEILPQVEEWVENEGIPKLKEMAGKIIDHIFEELGKMPGRLLEWAAGLPMQAWNGIKNDWNTLTSIGGDIINGIVEGINNMPNAIADAIIGMASGGLDQIKNFFGIASPSKLMRDEVGRFIPMGVAEGMNEYASIVGVAGENIGNQAMLGVNSALNGYQYGGVNPQITPVMNMGSFNNSLDAYRNSMASIQANGEATLQEEIAVKVNFESLLDSLGESLNAATDKINSSLVEHKTDTKNYLAEIRHIANSINNGSADYKSILKDINASLDEIRENSSIHGPHGLGWIEDQLFDIQNFTCTIKEIMQEGQNVYMDTGSLVGAIAPEMDNQLGYREIQSYRGNM